MKTSAVISVIGKDRTGIVAAISATLLECGANIDDIRQTILGDIFTMTMIVSLDEEKCSFDKTQDLLAVNSESLGVQITLQRKDVFDYMYKI
ncbi:MAG: ACT domain-containing protein [Coriobacteriales bacterium]|nr:ACT domain-containing protein [Coriobacteriales bacterium]